LAETSPTEEVVIDAILGHESEGASTGKKVYSHGDYLQHKTKLLNKLSYEIDFMKIRKWDSSSFYRSLK